MKTCAVLIKKYASKLKKGEVCDYKSSPSCFGLYQEKCPRVAPGEQEKQLIFTTGLFPKFKTILKAMTLLIKSGNDFKFNKK